MLSGVVSLIKLKSTPIEFKGIGQFEKFVSLKKIILR